MACILYARQLHVVYSVPAFFPSFALPGNNFRSPDTEDRAETEKLSRGHKMRSGLSARRHQRRPKWQPTLLLSPHFPGSSEI